MTRTHTYFLGVVFGYSFAVLAAHTHPHGLGHTTQPARPTTGAANRDFARPHLPVRQPTDPPVEVARTVPVPAHSPTQVPEPTQGIKARIEWCESRDNPKAINRATGASGAYQFLDPTWRAVTHLPGKASDYPLTVQTQAFDALYAASGTRPWAASEGCWR